MAGLSASGLKTQIKSYTETDSNVLTDAVLENIILNAQYKIFRDKFQFIRKHLKFVLIIKNLRK